MVLELTCMSMLVLQLVMEVLKKLEGAYALLIKSRHYPGELVACKRGSPMIVGVKEGKGALDRVSSIGHIKERYEKQHWSSGIECWVASDASAVIEHTKR